MFHQPTLDEICTILEALDRIPRPYGDNENDPINGNTVYPYLSPKHQDLVDRAVTMLQTYTRVGGQELNNRSITYLKKRGYSVSLGTDQHDPYRLVGYVRTENWLIDLSDASCEP